MHSCHKDSRFDISRDLGGPRTTHTMLCVPVLTAAGGILGVLEVVNKHGGNPESPFTGELGCTGRPIAAVRSSHDADNPVLSGLLRRRREADASHFGAHQCYR